MSELSDIATIWADVREANQGVAAAQSRLLARYGDAIHNYLSVLLRQNPDAVNDLYQLFAQRLLEGRFKKADPALGKFRRYVKTTLINLVAQYYNERARQPLNCGDSIPEPTCEDPSAELESDGRFLEVWRVSLIKAALAELRALETSTGRPFYTVLQMRLNDPEVRTRDLCEQLQAVTGQEYTENRVRRLVHDARHEFSAKLLRLVEGTLATAGLDELEQELIELELHKFCRRALEHRRRGRFAAQTP